MLARQLIIERAQIDLHYLETGDTPFFWSFDSLIDIESSHQHSLDNYAVEKDIFSVRPQSNDPYFWLNFNGRLLDLQHYPYFQIRIFSAKEEKLQLHASCSPENIFQLNSRSRPIPLKPGWQTIELNLTKLLWYDIIEKKDKRLCDGGPVSGLRVDPVVFANEFHIDQIKIRSAWPAGLGIQDVSTFYFDEWLYTPERLSQFAGKVWLQYPSAIVLPSAMVIAAKKQTETTTLDWSIVFCVLLALLSLLSWSPYIKKRASIQLLVIVCATVITMQLVPFVTKSMFLLGLDVGLYLLLLIAMLRIDARFGWREGVGLNTGLQPWLIVGIGTAILLLFLIGLGFILGIMDGLDIESISKRIYRYLLLAFIQQLILGPILALTLSRLTSSHVLAVLVAASVFSLFHFPNVPLAAVTFVAGLLWGHVYLRYGTILPQVISHVLLGSVFLLLIPVLIGGSGKVGFNYFPSIGY
ncbi:MAG: CPBP family intramembrane metalloprotease [Gammaproteobacteria bacterium]|nr:CPBP family intramembrane metalloprotease [Gammaproteobacteria bacterium]